MPNFTEVDHICMVQSPKHSKRHLVFSLQFVASCKNAGALERPFEMDEPSELPKNKVVWERWSQHRGRVVITDPREHLVFFVTSQGAKFQSWGFFVEAFAKRAEAVKGKRSLSNTPF